MRARLWLRGDWLGQRNEQSLLWLHLNDGRVLAFRLPTADFENDEPIGELAEQFAQDQRGTLLEARFGDGVAIPLYAAPPAPLPALPWGDPRHQAARDFAQRLDQEVLSLLASLNRHRQWDSLRNYNRLAALDPELRERRLQAVTRFPLLAAPVLLSAHQRLDFAGGKRHAWRDHDDGILEAIDHGRDLAGALGRHYGISKGLARSPICREMWGPTGLAHRRLLRLLDGIPAHRRPRAPADFVPAMDLLVVINLLADDKTDLAHLGNRVFREGFAAVCAPLQTRFAPLGPAVADCGDFIRAAVDHAVQTQPCPPGLTPRRLQLAWIESRGFRSLLAASRRWHALPRDRAGDAHDQTRVAAILGEHRAGEAHGRELCTAADLAHEGETMHHCVAQYWDQCLEAGTRVFALAMATERATAEYRFTLGAARFSLAQLRGPYNEEASEAMMAFALSVQDALNAPGRTEVRTALAASFAAGRIYRRHHPPRRLDPASERELTAVLTQLRPDAAPGELLRDFVAGYEYHAGPELEPIMGVGDALELVREPDNPHDPAAVALCWRGERIGYVPRQLNADIARRLDAAQPLLGQLTRLDMRAVAWQRVQFVIRQVQVH